jgi:ADP-ribosylglycohydrolase
MLPDTNVRDRLLELNDEKIAVAAAAKKYGNSGYVAHSVPLAIYAAQQVGSLGFEEVLMQLVYSGGDIDTNCSLAGQMMGALIGYENIPETLKNRLDTVHDVYLLKSLLPKFEKLAAQQT